MKKIINSLVVFVIIFCTFYLQLKLKADLLDEILIVIPLVIFSWIAGYFEDRS